MKKIIPVLVLLGVFASFLFLKGKLGGEKVSYATNSDVVEITPSSEDLGNVPINGGVIERDYEIKNTANKPVRLNKIVTSCMCTSAMVTSGDKSTKFFGMEMPGDKNALVNMDIPAGGTAKVTVKFDPAAHGPSGVGPFERVVSLNFLDPIGVREIRFKGVVTS